MVSSEIDESKLSNITSRRTSTEYFDIERQKEENCQMPEGGIQLALSYQ
jgi:hypothetical protein